MASVALPSSRNGLEVAIIGLSGRFPGARNIEEFWENLRAGVDSISVFTDDELLSVGVSRELLSNPRFVRSRGIIEDIELFDASFFGYSPREAQIMDPQQRIFLECAWAALEDAGYAPRSCEGRVGVYAGIGINSYFLNYYSNPATISSIGYYPMIIGNDKDFLATRVSYMFDLKGPSLVIQTACSTSLVAVHLACRALLSGECDMALAGGISVSVPMKSGYLYQDGGILSPAGTCRAFDARASGTVPGSGVGIVVLKRLDDAIDSHDHIRAVIKGSAINNDGVGKIGFTAPSIQGQAQVIRMAQLLAEVEPETITYIEAHGTGTSLGDPIEVKALTEAFRAGTDKIGFCRIGSVKTNIGHLDTAAGVTGLIKTTLAIERKEIPPSLHFEHPNPQIDFANSPFIVNNQLSSWKSAGAPRRAGVSSFGLGGTNAHVILEEAPDEQPSQDSRQWQLLALSARTNTALDEAAANLAAHLRMNPALNVADVAYTLQVGRESLEHRKFAVCHDLPEAISAIESGNLLYGTPAFNDNHIVFMFPGGGSQYVNMGQGLYNSEPVYRHHADHCYTLLKPELKGDLQSIVYPETGHEAEAALHLKRPSIALPALFVSEYAMAKLWMAWGIKPQAMIGHSLGEYVAACLAGVLSLEEALSLVALRGRLFEKLPRGAMLSVSLSEREVRSLIDHRLSVAAVNSFDSCVISGPEEEIDNAAALLTSKNHEYRKLHIDVAAHSMMVEPIIGEFTRFIEGLHIKAPTIPYISNVTGTWITEVQTRNPNYWADHLRQTVRFADGLRELTRETRVMLLEVGPGQTLATLVNDQNAVTGGAVAFTSMRHPMDTQQDLPFVLTTLGKLWLAGVKIDWRKVHSNESRRRVALPTYPFERQRFWPALSESEGARPKISKALPEKRRDISNWFYIPSWKRSFPPAPRQLVPSKTCWLVFTDEYGLGDQLVKCLKNENYEVFVVKAGKEYNKQGSHEYTINPRSTGDYRYLLDELFYYGKFPGKIIHIWSSTSPREDRIGVDSFKEMQDRGYYSLLFLTQALVESKDSIERSISLNVISNGLQEVVYPEIVFPDKAPILGLCLVIPQELQQIACRCIDIMLPEADNGQCLRLATQLIEEIKADPTDLVVAYRGDQRWVKTFSPVQLNNSGGPGRLRHRGAYLITGGLGGIGLHVAQYLARKYQARLALVSRGGLPQLESWPEWLLSHSDEDEVSQKIRRVQELIDLGAEVRVIGADISDFEQMRNALSEIDDCFGELSGVFHAAGVRKGKSASCPLIELGRAESEEQFKAKVYGSYVLSEVLRGRKLDFCLAFSSNASVLGGLGYAAYSAANLFLDIFAVNQQKIGDTVWISANWDGWQLSQTVNVAPSIVTSLDRYRMLPEESLDALERVLQPLVWGQVAISAGDLLDRMSLWVDHETIRQPHTAAATGKDCNYHPRPPLKTTYLAPRNEIERRVAHIWQELIGIEPVGVDDNFFELGGHSLMATRIITCLRDAFEIKIPLRSLFEAPTVCGLTRLITERLASQVDDEMAANLYEARAN